MGALSKVYERTGLCPHTSVCDSFSAIINCESWMEKSLRNLWSEGMDSLHVTEDGYTEDGLQRRLYHMRRVKERCYSYNHRCLRFWQLEKQAKIVKEKFGWRARASVSEKLLDSFSVVNNGK
jgi:hypothetical protein